MLARHTGPALLVRAVEAAPPIEMRNVFHNPVDKDMIAPDAGPALVVMPINDHGHADPPCRCLGSMSAAEVLRKSPPSLGTACPTVGTTTMQRSRTTGTGIRSSTANNGQFMQVENDYLRVVPASRLREFAEFLRNQGPKTSDPRFVASCTCITKECMLGLDAGLILRLEADVRLAAYHAYILPVWGAVRDFVWPSGVGDGGSGGFFWTNEHGDKGGNGTVGTCINYTKWYQLTLFFDVVGGPGQHLLRGSAARVSSPQEQETQTTNRLLLALVQRHTDTTGPSLLPPRPRHHRIQSSRCPLDYHCARLHTTPHRHWREFQLEPPYQATPEICQAVPSYAPGCHG